MRYLLLPGLQTGADALAYSTNTEDAIHLPWMVSAMLVPEQCLMTLSPVSIK